MGESGVGTMLLGVQHDKAVERLTRFAALVAAAEREACAKVCDEVDKESQSQWPKRLATMIRARSKA
jgi:hypothetical protein